MMWQRVHRAEEHTRDIADRHYNRQSVGAANFMPPGRALVLLAKSKTGRATWGTSWPFPEYVKHQWAGAWVCSIFRHEGAGVASELVRDAVAVTRYVYGEPPGLGMVTFVNRAEVLPTMVRSHPVYGWCFRKAGFEEVGETKGGLLALMLRPENMPPPAPPLGHALDLFA
jgi:hypothetical protein